MSSGAPLRPWPGRSTVMTRRPASVRAVIQPVSSQLSLEEEEKPCSSSTGRRPASSLGSCTPTYSWGSVPSTVWECCSPVCLPLMVSVLIKYGAQADPALRCLFLRDRAHDAGGVIRHLEHDQRLTDVDFLTRSAMNTHYLTRLGAGQFDRGLGGFNLHQGLVALHLVAGGNEPFQHRCLDQALAQVRQGEGKFSHVCTPILAGCRRGSGQCSGCIRPPGPRRGRGRRSR